MSSQRAQPSDLECGSGGQASGGGGVLNRPGLAFGLRRATVAYNSDGAAGSPDCSGTFSDEGGNTVGDHRGCVLVP